MRQADADNEWLRGLTDTQLIAELRTKAMRNPTLMDDDELADELAMAETMAKNLGANWQAEARLFRLRSEMAFTRNKETDMADFPFTNDASQAERKMTLENDRKASSYMAHAAANAEEDRGGRYAASGSSPRVIGASPISYPTQPSTSFWSRDPVPDEPPLGYCVEDHDAVGELHEREASAAPVEATNRMDTAATAAPALSHVVTGAVAVKPRRRL
jgi:hypothetical protein